MNINAISSFNNVAKAKAQAFKGEDLDKYRNPDGTIKDDVSDDTVVAYGTWDSTYRYPVTAGQERERMSRILASQAAEAGYAPKQPDEPTPEPAEPERPLSIEEIKAQSTRYLRD